MIEALKAKLQAEVERLNHEINFVLPKEIEKARAHGDLRENSEYKAALERQQFAQARASPCRTSTPRNGRPTPSHSASSSRVTTILPRCPSPWRHRSGKRSSAGR